MLYRVWPRARTRAAKAGKGLSNNCISNMDFMKVIDQTVREIKRGEFESIEGIDIHVKEEVEVALQKHIAKMKW
ncbi:hypothetical protein L1987_71387 [Smallanthus sonchifolius]|uniref:Uncharacterized protein n=1 Tax=Smallanthus sonchifolius TaxID=185202 RepID=A0ACB9AS95_9ASTR|nr:hypothetical protein L1987_71387 [Smallanthus sonchifolius]